MKDEMISSRAGAPTHEDDDFHEKRNKLKFRTF